MSQLTVCPSSPQEESRSRCVTCSSLTAEQPRFRGRSPRLGGCSPCIARKCPGWPCVPAACRTGAGNRHITCSSLAAEQLRLCDWSPRLSGCSPCITRTCRDWPCVPAVHRRSRAGDRRITYSSLTVDTLRAPQGGAQAGRVSQQSAGGVPQAADASPARASQQSNTGSAAAAAISAETTRTRILAGGMHAPVSLSRTR